MSGKGNCYDNSMVETFFKSIKAELIWRNKWDTCRQAEGAIFQYINPHFPSNYLISLHPDLYLCYISTR